MRLQITGRHVEVTEPIKAHVEGKVDRLRRYFEGIHGIQVILHKEKTFSRVELVAGLVRGKTIVVRGEDADMYVAIDQACRKAETALTRFKNKVKGEKSKQWRKAGSKGR